MVRLYNVKKFKQTQKLSRRIVAISELNWIFPSFLLSLYLSFNIHLRFNKFNGIFSTVSTKSYESSSPNLISSSSSREGISLKWQIFIIYLQQTNKFSDDLSPTSHTARAAEEMYAQRKDLRDFLLLGELNWIFLHFIFYI